MRRIFLSVLVLIIISGCGVFKRNTKTTAERFNSATSQTKMQTTAEITRVKAGQQLIFKRDSIGADYTMRLWPKGNLSFSPGGGFTGQFDSILLVGKQKQQRVTAQSVSTHEQENDKISTTLTQESKKESGEKNRAKTSTPDIKWIGGILVLIVIVFFMLKKRWFVI